jgi:hypothetical protein
MAPTEDLLRNAEAAEQLAAWIGGRDRDRLIEIAADLRRRAASRDRLRFWMSAPKSAPRQVTGCAVDEDWQDPDWVRFIVTTATGPALFEAPRAMLPQLIAALTRLSLGEPPHAVVLEPIRWQFMTGQGGMALRVDLMDGGALCLPLARQAAANLLSWLDVGLGGLRLRPPRRRPVAAKPPTPPESRNSALAARFYVIDGEQT